MASYDVTYVDRRSSISSTRRVYSRDVAAAVRSARGRGDKVEKGLNGRGRRLVTITDRDLQWQRRYVEVQHGTPVTP